MKVYYLNKYLHALAHTVGSSNSLGPSGATSLSAALTALKSLHSINLRWKEMYYLQYIPI